MAADRSPLILEWLLDTRPLWPAATTTASLPTHAARALALLSPEERASVLRYVHVRDAKMSLASALLKHYLAARHAAPPSSSSTPPPRWHATPLTRDARTKPIFATCPHLSFNISHQAGLVALVAAVGATPPSPAGVDVDVGVDVVSPTERAARDSRMVRDEGWARFVDVHADVFAAGEARYLKHAVLAGAGPGGVRAAGGGVLAYKLRAFYTLWCLREAYVKMTGEALLAEWLGELEFRDFRPPPPVAEGLGEAVTAHDIWFRGEKVVDANVCLRSLGEDYMLCTALRTPENKDVGLSWELGKFEMLNIDDILDFAESRI